jgi:hypothetical protein
MNFFIERTINCLYPYQYDETLNVSENQRNEFFQKTMNIFDLIIIPIGLFMLLRMKSK